MLTSHRVSSRVFWGTALVGVMTVALSLGLVSRGSAAPKAGARAVVATGVGKVDELIPTVAADYVKEVIPLGKDNVYLVQNTTMVEVYQMQADDFGARNVRLGQIPIPNGVTKILVLDDKSSFIIQNKVGLAVFSVSKEPMIPAASN